MFLSKLLSPPHMNATRSVIPPFLPVFIHLQSMNQTKRPDSEIIKDEFWDVALTGHEIPRFQNDDDDDSSSESSSEDISTKRTLYRLDCTSGPPFRVSLSSLAPKSGIWSPLGSDVWYGSALLTAFLFAKEDRQTSKRLHRFLVANILERTSEFNVLELGSGAVGLSGLAIGWMLRYHPAVTRQRNQKTRIRVVLTDNDDNVLWQLKRNVDYNLQSFEKDPEWTSKNIQYCVEYLDWSKPSPDLSQVQLVIGSELVYNNETAQACAQVVCSLMKQNPHVLIIIIQVSDRDGWSNMFIPRLRQHDNLVVKESVLSDPFLHERASELVPFGGTLNRDDYSLCYIYSNQTTF